MCFSNDSKNNYFVIYFRRRLSSERGRCEAGEVTFQARRSNFTQFVKLIDEQLTKGRTTIYSVAMSPGLHLRFSGDHVLLLVLHVHRAHLGIIHAPFASDRDEKNVRNVAFFS